MRRREDEVEVQSVIRRTKESKSQSREHEGMREGEQVEVESIMKK